MRSFIALLIVMQSSICFSQSAIRVIFDTDMGPDFDDVGAITLLHNFQDQGKAKILATISCNAYAETTPSLSVFNTYFKRPEIPIGVVKASKPNEACREGWAQAINKKYPHKIKSNDEVPEAVGLYRKILAAQPDNSVTIITVGFFTNLANLLASPPDKNSPLTGKDLVARKVKQLVSMAAGIGSDGKSAHEFNVWADAVSAKKVFAEWPTPMLISGFEIGVKILTGVPLINNEKINNSPVKDAYTIALKATQKEHGQCSWDQTAVLVAIAGYTPYFDVKKLNFEIKDDGTNVLIPGEKFTYLVEKMPVKDVAAVIEAMMMHTPNSK
ncbi:MAG TPA: nucleoside hydrolase [Cyclobacteriaceae bacterium]|nr:nucleoside hydrolase [Cyclobacteriaceae bacterium]